ncbi:glycosyltransferase [Methylomonas rapida]|uniref:Glycosyltransferase n=1 Tax=Methylomonas rapida TaxID=2963939 RepID=A0ABY7GQ18_9GAMM|nr:glycosyltransferase [Methylomonas rapida]WAR46604.1 glycosyltransferase [Methylomonas rapida]
MSQSVKQKVLIFIVAYNAEKTIVSVIDRIPRQLLNHFDLSLLIIDDCSKDNTQRVAFNHLKNGYWCPFMVMRNPENQGYGGNQKVGYHYAIENGFDAVVLLHGDGQYAPECLPVLLDPFANEEGHLGAVFGSRMLNRRDALEGGMPLYKFVGNQILTAMQNKLLGSQLSEFHTGYRVYSVKALQNIPFDLNTNDFHFDTEIIVQMFFSGARVVELPIPTYYGDEVCHVDGLKYAWDVTKASIKARLIRMGIFFDPKFSIQGEQASNYVSKFEFHSTHSVSFSQVPEKSVVLDLGCADGYLSERLYKEKGCTVFSVDMEAGRSVPGCSYQSCDLNNSLPDVPWEKLNVVVLLDVIEHLNNPELFLERLRDRLSGNDKVKIIVSSGNVCFFVTRIMMFIGQFNYGRRGILDITHTRLFTVGSLERLVRYAAYNVIDRSYIPAPYPLAIGLNSISIALVKINSLVAKIFPGLFAYQSLYVIKPRPSIKWLLSKATESVVLERE